MQYHKIFLVVLLILITIPPVSAQYGYYTIPVMGLSNAPLDNILNYLGNKPSAPETVVNRSVIFMPTAGVIERAEIFDNCTVAGSAEAYSYYVSVNNATDYLIATLAVSQNLRVFSNAAINIPVVAGDKIQIKRKHPAWATNPTANVVGGYLFINSTIDGYTLSTMGLTTSVANNTITYMGYRPIAPSTTAATNKLFVPMAGNITRVDINDYSGTAGNSQAYNYSIQRNGGMSTVINSLSISANQRLFNNTNLNLNVNRGDYIELWRWIGIGAVPATNIVGGTVFVNTNYSCDPHGYPIWFQALTSSPVDGQTVYFGNKPAAPAITAGFNKVYIPKTGTLNRAEFYVYSGTAGTKEGWELYIQKNGAGKTLISYSNVSANERMFKNATINLPVTAGDYLEIMGKQPTWPTNPATTIYGGYVVIDYAASSCTATTVLPPVAQFSVNLTPGPEGMTAQFFSQSNNTIPDSTKYSWNFTDGGTKEDSDLENPSFVYTAAGTYTVRLRVTNPGSITDTMTKTNYITVYVPAATPTPCPVCCDNFTTSLLHYEGADHSVDIIDENTANTWILRNVGEITTDQQKFGVSSYQTTDAFSMAEMSPSATTVNLGKGCWTWETWIRYDDVDPATDHGIFTWGAYGAGHDSAGFYHRNIAGNDAYVFNIYNGIVTEGSFVYYNAVGEYNVDQWYHLELSRNLSAINFSIDGDQKTWNLIAGSFDETSDVGNPGNITLGYDSTQAFYLDGWMDETRLSVGVQRHYGDFAVETEAYDYDPCTGGSSTCTSSGGDDNNYDDGTTLWIIAIPCIGVLASMIYLKRRRKRL